MTECLFVGRKFGDFVHLPSAVYIYAQVASAYYLYELLLIFSFFKHPKTVSYDNQVQL